MIIFIDCLIEHSLENLVISGPVPPEKLLEKTWLDILSEYTQLRNETAGETWLMMRDISRMQLQLFMLDQCIKVLQVTYIESAVDTLNKLGYPFRPTSQKPEDYVDQLLQIVERSKSKYIRLQQMIREYEQRISSQDGNSKPTYEYFESVLIELEQMQKTSYSLSDMTVHKFVILEKKLERMIEKQQSKMM